MNAKLAAKFGHINFNPGALKVGAAPPKRQKRKQEIDHSVAINKVTVAKKGRRKRTKKRVIIEDDNEESVSLFAKGNQAEI